MVLAGAVVSATGSLIGSIVLFRLLALAGVALTAWALPTLARRCGVPVERALWLALACPLVAVHLVGGAHNDALMVGLLTAGLAVVASRPGRPGPLLAGGLLLGLAAGLKVTALVVVPFAALAAIAGPYRFRALLRDGGWVVGAAVATVVGVTFAAGLDFGWVTGLEQGNLVIAWTSPSTAVGQTVGYLAALFGAHVDALPATRAIGVLVLAVLLVWLWWRARHREPLWHAGLALAATVALAPLFHPWYWTWPLAVLAATARRTGWFALVALVSSFLVLADGTGLARYTKTARGAADDAVGDRGGRAVGTVGSGGPPAGPRRLRRGAGDRSRPCARRVRPGPRRALRRPGRRGPARPSPAGSAGRCPTRPATHPVGIWRGPHGPWTVAAAGWSAPACWSARGGRCAGAPRRPGGRT